MEGHGNSHSVTLIVDEYIAGRSDVIYVQLVNVARTCPDRLREFAKEAAREVATRYCEHGDEAPRVLEGRTTASRAISIEAYGGHGGLCGKHQADTIAGVRTRDVLARNDLALANKYRNQVRPPNKGRS